MSNGRVGRTLTSVVATSVLLVAQAQGQDARNDLRVADHDVVLETGVTVHNPIRVVPNRAGSTVIFTLMRLPDVSQRQFKSRCEDSGEGSRDSEALLEQW